MAGWAYQPASYFMAETKKKSKLNEAADVAEDLIALKLDKASQARVDAEIAEDEKKSEEFAKQRPSEKSLEIMRKKKGT